MPASQPVNIKPLPLPQPGAHQQVLPDLPLTSSARASALKHARPPRSAAARARTRGAKNRRSSSPRPHPAKAPARVAPFQHQARDPAPFQLGGAATTAGAPATTIASAPAPRRLACAPMNVGRRPYKRGRGDRAAEAESSGHRHDSRDHPPSAVPIPSASRPSRVAEVRPAVISVDHRQKRGPSPNDNVWGQALLMNGAVARLWGNHLNLAAVARRGQPRSKIKQTAMAERPVAPSLPPWLRQARWSPPPPRRQRPRSSSPGIPARPLARSGWVSGRSDSHRRPAPTIASAGRHRGVVRTVPGLYRASWRSPRVTVLSAATSMRTPALCAPADQLAVADTAAGGGFR